MANQTEEQEIEEARRQRERLGRVSVAEARPVETQPLPEIPGEEGPGRFERILQALLPGAVSQSERSLLAEEAQKSKNLFEARQLLSSIGQDIPFFGQQTPFSAFQRVAPELKPEFSNLLAERFGGMGGGLLQDFEQLRRARTLTEQGLDPREFGIDIDPSVFTQQTEQTLQEVR